MGEVIPFPDRHGPAMFCSGCGAERTVPNAAADPGPCPTCGTTTRQSWPPNVGGPPWNGCVLVTGVPEPEAG